MINSDTVLAIIAMLGSLVLVGSALGSQRLTLGRKVKFALAWIVIIAAAFFLFSWLGV